MNTAEVLKRDIGKLKQKMVTMRLQIKAMESVVRLYDSVKGPIARHQRRKRRAAAKVVRRVSVVARRNMSFAQKARWARTREQKAKK